jgi:transcriptional regulator with XRE-family HTH domain
MLKKLNNIAERLIEIRETLGFEKKSEFAKILNITPSMYTLYENGTNTPKQKLNKFKTLFNVDPNWIMTGEGQMFLPGGALEGEFFKKNKKKLEQQETTPVHPSEVELIKEENYDKLLEMTFDKIRNISQKDKKHIYHLLELKLTEI